MDGRITIPFRVIRNNSEVRSRGNRQDAVERANRHTRRLRKKFHIEPGTEMQIMEYGGIIYLIPPVDDPVRAACGALPAEPSLGDRLLLDRKKDSR